MANTGGETRPRGDLTVQKNPERATPPGVALRGIWITARYQDGDLTVSVGGSAAYGERTAGTTIDVTDRAPDLKRAMAGILEAHAEQIEWAVMEAAYEARALARRRGGEV